MKKHCCRPKIKDVGGHEVLKNTKFNALKTKANNLNNKIPDATTLIDINKNIADKKSVEKKNWRCS